MKSQLLKALLSGKALTSLALQPTAIIAFALFFSVAGCSESNGDGSYRLTPSQPLLSQPSAGGVWVGSTFNDQAGESSPINGIITEENGEARFLSDAGQLFLLSDIKIDGGDISAIVAAFAGFGTTFIDESSIASGTLTGSLIERASIEAVWSLDTGETGSMVLAYDNVYERESDLARLAGMWISSFGTVFIVDVSGEIFAQDANGCVYAGQIDIIDASYNAYSVRMMDHCLAFEVDGLGMLTDDSGTDDAFVLMLNWKMWIFAEVLFRL